jgi:predicted transcriptional regulator
MLVWKRADLLGEIPAAGVDRSVLLDRMASTRTTQDRALDELARANLVELRDERVSLTLAGTLALESLRQLRSRVDDVVAVASILDPLGADAPMSLDMLADARVVPASDVEGDGLRARVDELVDRATHLDVFSPRLSEPHISSTRERITSGGLTMRVVTTTPVVERLVSTHRDYLTAVLQADRYQIRQCDELPYTLLVSNSPDGDRACVVVYDTGEFRGFLCNDDTPALSWARDTFESVWRRSSPLPYRT